MYKPKKFSQFLIVSLCATVINADVRCYECKDCLEPFNYDFNLIKDCAASTYGKYNGPGVNYLSTDTNKFACYTLTKVVDCVEIQERGCTLKSSHICTTFQNIPDYSACTVCMGDECNGAVSIKLSMTTIIGFTTLLLLLSMHM